MSETKNISKAKRFSQGLMPENDTMLNGQRKAALEKFHAIDFPTTKTEEWKYTRVGKIANSQFEIIQNKNSIDISPFTVHLNAILLVFVNGFYRSDLSVINENEGVIICDINKAKEAYPDLIGRFFNSLSDKSEEAFTALNTACVTDGAFIHVSENVELPNPIHVLHLIADDNCIAQTKNLVIAEKGSKATVTQSFEAINNKASFTNCVTEAFIEPNATLSFDVLQNDHGNYHINSWHVSQEQDSTLNSATVCANASLIRNGFNVSINGVNCDTHLNGIYLPSGAQHFDNHTLIDHRTPHCESHELYKGIMYDKSTAVFNGKVFVRPDAQKVNAFQQNNNILMSDDADVNSKPELEIYADDVKCSHGSTTGQFDEQAVFYLRTRGLSENSARKMLIGAFADEVLEKLSSAEVRQKANTLINEKLNAL